MTTVQICMLALTGVSATVIIRQWKADFAPLLRLAIALLLATLAVSSASPLVELIRELTLAGGVGEYAEILLKALGIAVLTAVCAQICRECGENGTASGVELVGKAEILLLCVPLINKILTAARNLLAWGT